MTAAPAADKSRPSAPDPADIVAPPLRADLVQSAQTYLRRRFVIYKNPLSLSYFRLPLAHSEAAASFDGRTPLGAIADALARRSAYWRALTKDSALAELSALASQLAQAGLLQVRGSSATERARRLREMKKSRGFEVAVGSVLFFKKSLFDPDRLLAAMLPWVAWIYRPGVLLAMASFVGISLGAALWNLDSIVRQGANFFTLSNLALTWLLFVVVKIFHEFGHGLTAKRFGAEVHEMGFMFILMTPYLFCNVSDVWRAGKKERVAVGSAGIAVEAVLASAAVWLWLCSSPGLFHQICFNTMVLCSVSTLLFNGNPLMKFDGYYILSDLLGIPNLRAKSNAWVTAWAQRRLLGLQPKAAAAPSHEVSPLFGFYAVAAYCYGWFIMYSISVKVFDMLEPYGLGFVSRTYVFLFLFVSLVLPLYRLARSLRDTSDLRAAMVSRGGYLIGVLVLAAAFVFFVPWTETIHRSAALEHARVEQVSASAPGILQDVFVGNGEAVVAGRVLGRVRNAELEPRLSAARLEVEAARVRIRQLGSEVSEEARLSLPVAERQLSEAEEQLRGLEQKAASLDLRAPHSGTVRTRRPAELPGRYFRANEPVFEIGVSGEPRILIALDELQARKVRPGQPVRVMFAALPGEVFRGEITASPVSPASGFTVPSFANMLGGDVPSAPPQSGGAPLPSIAYYEAEASLQIDPAKLALLRPQSAGRAGIEIGRSSLALWLRDKFYDFVSPQIRL